MELQQSTQPQADISQIVGQTLDCFAARFGFHHENSSPTHFLDSPPSFPDADYSCRIQVYLSSNGEIGIIASRYALPQPKVLPERMVPLDTLSSCLEEMYQKLYPL